MPLTIAQFFDRLRESDVLTAGEVDGLWKRIPKVKQQEPAERIAPTLVKSGNLTKYQASALLEDQGRTLVLGEYLILDKIGAGGMGQVFKARHRRMKRLVAIKVLSRAFFEKPEAIKRFQREVEAAAKLTHPNIVAAHDAGEQKGIHYLVMEYVEGDDLAHVVRKRGTLPVELALSYVAQAAKGLAHAHKQGVIHRDIKPANLLLDQEGTVNILDMGLARFDDQLADGSDEGLTNSGAVMGTIDYMSPEQALDTKTAGPQADIYSLGCTLYFLLMGRRMYEGDTVMKRLLGHRELPIPALDERSDVPASVKTVFRAMVAKRPADRYPSMAKVQQELEACGFALTTGDVRPHIQALSNEPTSGLAENNTFDPIIDLGALELSPQTMPNVSQQPALGSWQPSPLVGPSAKHASAGGKSRPPLLFWYACAGLVAVLIVAIPIALLIGLGMQKRDRPEAAAKPAKASGRANVVKGGDSSPANLKPPDKPTQGDVFENSLKVKMVYIPSGEFEMGSPATEKNRRDDEKLHRVRITKGFYMGAHEVTVGQFREFVQKSRYKTDAETDGKGGGGWHDTKGFEQKAEYTWRNVGFVQGEDHPVVNVSWNDAKAFCEWLSKEERRTYRLATEAEWEYACRAGTKTAYANGSNSEALAQVGNVADGTAKAKFPNWPLATESLDGHLFTAPVGRFQPNAFGLFDMHGNAGEWCGDWYTDYTGDAVNPKGSPSGVGRVIRGGAWNGSALYCRSASRSGILPVGRDLYYGFRVVLVK